MAVVIVNEMEGADSSIYDEVNPKIMPGGKLPDGCECHIAGPIDGGWRVITVWESEDRFNEFRNDKLLPALKEAGAEGRIAPKITANPVHKLLKD
jgi:hypothetical protein